jgi:hypothetical protein
MCLTCPDILLTEYSLQTCSNMNRGGICVLLVLLLFLPVTLTQSSQAVYILALLNPLPQTIPHSLLHMYKIITCLYIHVIHNYIHKSIFWFFSLKRNTICHILRCHRHTWTFLMLHVDVTTVKVQKLVPQKYYFLNVCYEFSFSQNFKY